MSNSPAPVFSQAYLKGTVYLKFIYFQLNLFIDLLFSLDHTAVLDFRFLLFLIIEQNMLLVFGKAKRYCWFRIDHLVLRLCKQFGVTTAVWISWGCCIAHVTENLKNHVAPAIVGAGNERFPPILHLICWDCWVQLRSLLQSKLDATVLEPKWPSPNGCCQGGNLTSWCLSFSGEHLEAAKICLHASVRPSMHLCLRCSCQQRRDVWLTAPPRC